MEREINILKSALGYEVRSSNVGNNSDKDLKKSCNWDQDVKITAASSMYGSLSVITGFAFHTGNCPHQILRGLQAVELLHCSSCHFSEKWGGGTTTRVAHYLPSWSFRENLGAAFTQGEYRGNNGTYVPAHRVRPEGEKGELPPPVRVDITADWRVDFARRFESGNATMCATRPHSRGFCEIDWELRMFSDAVFLVRKQKSHLSSETCRPI